MMDLGSARHWARAYQMEALKAGGVAVDATMGNGGDTEALCEAVGENGRVYAFDVQPSALAQTKARLLSGGLAERARLFLHGHEDMAEFVKEKVDLVVFNLGWLPGSEDKCITTRSESTIRALDAAFSLLKKGGLITLCAYPGHEEGAREMQAVLSWAKSLPGEMAQALVRMYVNQPPAAPVLLVVQRLKA